MLSRCRQFWWVGLLCSSKNKSRVLAEVYQYIVRRDDVTVIIDLNRRTAATVFNYLKKVVVRKHNFWFYNRHSHTGICKRIIWLVAILIGFVYRWLLPIHESKRYKPQNVSAYFNMKLWSRYSQNGLYKRMKLQGRAEGIRALIWITILQLPRTWSGTQLIRVLIGRLKAYMVLCLGDFKGHNVRAVLELVLFIGECQIMGVQSNVCRMCMDRIPGALMRGSMADRYFSRSLHPSSWDK